MNIQNFFSEPPLTAPVEHRYIGRDGETHLQLEPVLTEHTVQVRVNDTLSMELVCLPQYLPELILGHLATEGYIRSAEDVISLSISENGQTAAVTLRELVSPGPLPMVTPRAWDPAWIFALADRFAAGMPVHEQTFATHSCFLARESELLFQCEDIGRHNALDKAIGFALMRGIDLHTCLLYSSGRMPIDMASKAIRVGVPLLASKGSPTAGAAELARQHGLTLLCAARRDRMKLFAGTFPK